MLSFLGLGWMQAGPNFVASRVPFHAGAGSGAFQRIAPVGGSAYGILLNTDTVPADTPCTVPAGAVTTGGAANAGAAERVSSEISKIFFIRHPGPDGI